MQLVTQSDNCTSKTNRPLSYLQPSQESLLTISLFLYIVSKIFNSHLVVHLGSLRSVDWENAV